jgi:proteasome lid subunit RPN8/RPN11
MIMIGLIPWLQPQPRADPISPLERARQRGEIRPGIPRLDADDAMANSEILATSLEEFDRATPCVARPRFFAIRLGNPGVLTRVRFGPQVVCELQRLKEISLAQSQTGVRSLGEVAAFILGRRRPGGRDVEVTRLVIPPFQFSNDSVYFPLADLGPLQDGERMIGTYHTHPEGDIEQGVLSETDLRFMETGYIDFHGQVGRLKHPRPGLDWLFDIVDPGDGEWNIFAHDQARLAALLTLCQARGGAEATCPVDELRIAGSPYYLLTRFYEESPSGATYF